jgi:NAD(P)H-dependent flavin oxidoreductase YrpB (nitropropane dioxygenase family)
MASPQKIRTPITDMFGIKHPILLAGMNVAAGPKLAAAVSNAGGLGVIGGVGYTPDMLREQIAELKEYLNDKNAPFGVDLLLPQVGGSARKTKYVRTGVSVPDLPPQIDHMSDDFLSQDLVARIVPHQDNMSLCTKSAC